MTYLCKGKGMTMKEVKYCKQSLLLVPMLMLPGCWTSQEKDRRQEPIEVENVAAAMTEKTVQDGSPALMKMNGRPLITLNSINADFDRLLEENPQFKQVLAFMPDAKLNFFQGMVSQEVINEYVHKNKIDQSPEYQKELEKTIEQVKHMLNMNYFNARHPAEVSEAEIRRFYDENKDKIPNLMESRGGVKAEGVSFANEDDARAFLTKAKEASQESLEKLATDAGFADRYQDFKLVNLQSAQVEPTLKAHIAKLSRFPALELFNADGKWWVVKAYSKTEPIYVPFDQVKPMLEEHLQKQKQAEVLEKVLDKYKKEYNVEINDAPLRTAGPDQEIDESMQHAQAQEAHPVTRAA